MNLICVNVAVIYNNLKLTIHEEAFTEHKITCLCRQCNGSQMEDLKDNAIMTIMVTDSRRRDVGCAVI